ncbi:MAG: FkbM family methyltransferase [Hyphomicrobium sp.]
MVQDAAMPMSEARWGERRPSLAARALLWMSRHTPLGRGSGRKLLFRVFSRLHEGPVDCMLWGAPVRLHPAMNVSERKALMRPDVVDAPELALLREAMSQPGACFVDVGGNAGLYSLAAALSSAPGARIVMIEPDPGLIARLDFNLSNVRRTRLIGDDVAVDCFELAIGEHEGEAYLSVDGAEGSRSILHGHPGTGRKVRLATLHSVVQLAGLSRIDIMKLDVEGYEDRVLPPFLASAERAVWPAQIIIEHLQRKTWRPDCITDALSRGYRQVATTRNNTILKRGAPG